MHGYGTKENMVFILLCPAVYRRFILFDRVFRRGFSEWLSCCIFVYIAVCGLYRFGVSVRQASTRASVYRRYFAAMRYVVSYPIFHFAVVVWQSGDRAANVVSIFGIVHMFVPVDWILWRKAKLISNLSKKRITWSGTDLTGDAFFYCNLAWLVL